MNTVVQAVSTICNRLAETGQTGWQSAPGKTDHYAELIKDKHQPLCFHKDGNRVSVFVKLDKYQDYNLTNEYQNSQTRCTFSIQRLPADVKAVTTVISRLIPTAKSAGEKVAQIHAQRNDYESQKETTKRLVTASLPNATVRGEEIYQYADREKYSGERIDIEVYAGRVNLKLSSIADADIPKFLDLWHSLYGR